MNAAVSLFRRTHDVNKVSLEAIAGEARVSPTTIYNNYGNREKLVFEVIKRLIRESLEKSRNLVRSDLPFPQKLIGIMNSKLDLASELNGDVIKKIMSQDKNIAPFVDEIYENEIKPLWQEILTDGKKQGYIKRSLDDNVLILYLDVLKAGFSARQEIVESFTINPGLIEQLTQMVFYGFLKKDVPLFEKKGR